MNSQSTLFHPIGHCSLSIVNFPGARLYHSTASVWLSVDPLSDKYPSVSPYVYCAGNPVRLVDPDGREVINRHEDAYNYWKNEVKIAQERFDAFGGNTKADGYKDARKDLNRAKRNCNRAEALYTGAQSAINNVKKYNPELYNKMDNLKDENGNTVDVLVGIDNSKENKGWGNIPNAPNCPEKVHITLNPSACYANGETTDMGEILSHEFGHFLYIVPHWSEYQDFLNTKVNRATHDGHGENNYDPSGQEAVRQAEIYIKNKNK